MTNKIFLTAGIAVLAGLTGCARNPAGPEGFNSDGLSGFVSSELVDMNGSVLEESLGQGTLAKSFSDTVEVVIDRWHRDSASNVFVRRATASYPNGERVRTDTVWFYDASGNPVTQNISVATVDSVRHVRHVTRTRNGNEVDFTLEMTGVIHRNNGDTTFVRSGSVVGTYNGVALQRGREVSNLTFRRTNGHWDRMPVSGTILITRVLYTVSIEFGGNHTATATITRKRDGETRTVIIDIETGEETES